MQQDEKVDFLFTQLQAVAGQIDRQTAVINVTRSDVIKQRLDINTPKSTVERQQAEITCQQAEIEQFKAENARLTTADFERERQLQQMRAADNTRGIEMNRLKERSSAVQRLIEALKAKHEDMRERYNSRNTKITDGVKRIKDGFEAEVLKKRDHDFEDLGNPDPSSTPEQPPTTADTQIVVFKPSEIGTTQGTSRGTVEEIQQLESSFYVESSLPGTYSTLSSIDFALQDIHPVIGEILEEGEFVADLSHEQILALNEMKAVEDSVIDQMLIEPETVDTENIDETVFESETSKSTYVRADGMEFDPFDEEWMKENREDIDEQLKNRTSTDNPKDSFQEWRKRFLSKIEKPTPPETQVDSLKFEKVKPHGKILSWMFVKEIHCVAIKREHGIQYFNSMLSILTLPFYDVVALSKLEIINRSNYYGATLFERKLKLERIRGWKDESYKPQFPVYQQIKYTLDPLTDTARYKLIYQPAKVMDKIPLMSMKQIFLDDMALWCYDLDSHEAVILLKGNKDNFCMLDPMWIVNMSADDINKLFRHDIFYEDDDAHQALRFQRVACFCYYRGIHASSTWSLKH
ncbi:hypothetical protein Hanom_Chr11g01036321 [Helianthus anomalus]